MSFRHASIGLFLLLIPFGARAQPFGLTGIGRFAHVDLGQVPLFTVPGSSPRAVAFASQMMVNTDGAPDSYHPDDIGITHLCNGVSVGRECTWKANCMPDFRKARAEGFRGATKICFFGMVADAQGVPVVQGPNDPAPGFYVSTTAFRQPGEATNRQQAYLNSNEIAFIVIPRRWQQQKFQGVGLGDFAAVLRKSNDSLTFAIVGDLGPNNKIGEGSVELHEALGNDPFQMRFGKRRAFRGIGGRDVVYLIFPGSRKAGTTVTPELIQMEGRRLLEAVGGEDRLREWARGM